MKIREKDCGDLDEITQKKHDEAKDGYEKARQAVWDSKDPHEPMSKKTSKADRLRKLVSSMEKELAESMEEKARGESGAVPGANRHDY